MLSVPFCIWLLSQSLSPVNARAPISFSDPKDKLKDDANCFVIGLKEGVSAGRKHELFEKTRGHSGKVWEEAVHGYYRCGVDKEQLEQLADDEDVAYIEEDQAMTHSEQWNLDLLDQRSLRLSYTKFAPIAKGLGITIYIVDSGIQFKHVDFGGRASPFFDAVGDGRNGADCYGHGTHVSSLAGGTTYGVAKKATLKSVRVLNCQGSGSVSKTISGLDAIASRGTSRGVVNLSLQGGKSTTLNGAIDSLVRRGYVVAVAAGNYGGNACNYSPSSASSALTVASISSSGYRASTSNYGVCVDIFAPGQCCRAAVWSAYSTSATASYCGTSMASPHVAGVAAALMQIYPTAKSTDVISHILNQATTGLVKNAGTGSPNRLLYIDPKATGGAFIRDQQDIAPISTPTDAPGSNTAYFGLLALLALIPAAGAGLLVVLYLRSQQPGDPFPSAWELSAPAAAVHPTPASTPMGCELQAIDCDSLAAMADLPPTPANVPAARP